MPVGLIIFLVVYGLLTLGGALLYCIKDYKLHINEPLGIRIVYYIYYCLLGAPYLVIRLIIMIVDKYKQKQLKYHGN